MKKIILQVLFAVIFSFGAILYLHWLMYDCFLPSYDELIRINQAVQNFGNPYLFQLQKACIFFMIVALVFINYSVLYRTFFKTLRDGSPWDIVSVLAIIGVNIFPIIITSATVLGGSASDSTISSLSFVLGLKYGILFFSFYIILYWLGIIYNNQKQHPTTGDDDFYSFPYLVWIDLMEKVIQRRYYNSWEQNQSVFLLVSLFTILGQVFFFV